MPPSPAQASSTRRLMILGLVVLLALGAFLFFQDVQAYRRLLVEDTALRQRIAEAQRQIKVDIPRARDHLAALEDEQEEFQYRERLPDDERLDELFDHLSEFERTAQVDWRQSITKDQHRTLRGSGSEPYDRLQYTLDLRGSFFEFCRFVNLLETMRRVVEIDEFTIKPAGRDAPQGEEVLCDIKLTFSVFTLKETPLPVKPAGAARGRGTARS